MGVKQYKPTSPGRRFQTVSDFADITSTTPEKSLLRPLPKKAGRNNNGRITTRHQGGGVKRRYRVIDFKRNKDGIPEGRGQGCLLRRCGHQARQCTAAFCYSRWYARPCC